MASAAEVQETKADSVQVGTNTSETRQIKGIFLDEDRLSDCLKAIHLSHETGNLEDLEVSAGNLAEELIIQTVYQFEQALWNLIGLHTADQKAFFGRDSPAPSEEVDSEGVESPLEDLGSEEGVCHEAVAPPAGEHREEKGGGEGAVVAAASDHSYNALDESDEVMAARFQDGSLGLRMLTDSLLQEVEYSLRGLTGKVDIPQGAEDKDNWDEELQAMTGQPEVDDLEEEAPGGAVGLDLDPYDEKAVFREHLRSQHKLRKELNENWVYFKEGAKRAAHQWVEGSKTLAVLLAEGIEFLERRAHKDREEPSEDVLCRMLANIGLSQEHVDEGDMTAFELWLQDLVRLLISRVIYPQMLSASERYPQWLEKQGNVMPEPSLRRYRQQYSLLKEALVHMENEKAAKDTPERNQAFTRSLKCICQSLELGEYPAEIQDYDEGEEAHDDLMYSRDLCEGHIPGKTMDEAVCLCQAAEEANRCSLM